MYASLLKLVQDTRSSFWFVPSCMLIGAVVLAMLLLQLDTATAPRPANPDLWFPRWQPDGARTMLSMIAGSILGVAGVTFSITIVAVSFAGANYGPRLIMNFMGDRGNQFTLGTFIATFAYTTLALQSIRGAMPTGTPAGLDSFVPYWTISVALLMTLGSLMVLIYFIHHVPETINIENIAADIGRRLRNDVITLFPNPDTLQEEGADDLWQGIDGRVHTSIPSSVTGYIQTLDEEELSKIARDSDLLMRVQYRPGDFMIDTDTVIDLWSRTPPDASTIESVQNCYAVGQHRTANQNVLFSTDQLAEVIARALSSGVNDPFTALTCLNWMKCMLDIYLREDERAGEQPASSRIRARPVDFKQIIASCFDQTRQYIATDRNVALHTMNMLAELAASRVSHEHRRTLVDQMSLLADTCGFVLTDEAAILEIRQRFVESQALIADEQLAYKARDSRNWFGGSA